MCLCSCACVCFCVCVPCVGQRLILVVIMQSLFSLFISEIMFLTDLKLSRLGWQAREPQVSTWPCLSITEITSMSHTQFFTYNSVSGIHVLCIELFFQPQAPHTFYDFPQAQSLQWPNRATRGKNNIRALGNIQLPNCNRNTIVYSFQFSKWNFNCNWQF